MLVLSRKRNERIVINDNVVVKVIAIKGDRVLLGFEAPDDVKIHREEVDRRIQDEARTQFLAGSSDAPTNCPPILAVS